MAQQQIPAIHLCLINPPGYLHGDALLDPAQYFYWQFTRLGQKVTLARNLLRHDAVNFVFGAHLGFDARLLQTHSCIIVNLEQTGQGGARLDGAPQSPALAQQDDAGIGLPGHEVALLGDIGGHHRHQRSDGAVIQEGQLIADGDRRRDMRPQGPRRARAHLLQDPPGPPAGAARPLGRGPVREEVAEADGLDAARLEVADPRPQGRLEGVALALGGEPAVAQPHGGVLDRVLRVALDDPGIDVVGEPLPHGSPPVGAGPVLPVAEHDEGAAVGEATGEAGHEVGQDGPAAPIVVAGGFCSVDHNVVTVAADRVGSEITGTAADIDMLTESVVTTDSEDLD